LLILTIITVVLSPNINALGQNSSSSSSNTTTTTTQQTWIDKLNNLKIQFGYLPAKPIIDAPTQLKFSVQNLQTGEQPNDLFYHPTMIESRIVEVFTVRWIIGGDN
jgi:hypothetical protein